MINKLKKGQRIYFITSCDESGKLKGLPTPLCCNSCVYYLRDCRSNKYMIRSSNITVVHKNGTFDTDQLDGFSNDDQNIFFFLSRDEALEALYNKDLYKQTTICDKFMLHNWFAEEI